MSSIVVALSAAEEAGRELPMPAWLFGVLALASFLFLLGVTWSFRGTHQKHAVPAAGAHGAPESAAGQDAAHWPEHPGQH